MPIAGFTQNVQLLTPLESAVSESSGLVYLNGKIITHTDSGGEAKLFEIDSTTGNVLRSVTILNATNTDWEDIAADETYIYIGDFGNNNGNRTNLRIYRILQSDYFESENDEAVAEVITFNYSDQTDFTSAPFSTNYDAEAMISYQDSLYIFTKNWGDNHTNVYAVSKQPGDYALERGASLAVGGMVTGADYHENSGKLILIGYTLVNPFVFLLSEFPEGQFFEGEIENYNLQMPSGYAYQIEGVTQFSPNHYFLTSEASFLGESGLFSLIHIPVGIEEVKEVEFSVSPNPATDFLTVNINEKITLKLFNSAGKLVREEDENTMNVSDLSRGAYLLEIRGSGNKLLATERIILN